MKVIIIVLKKIIQIRQYEFPNNLNTKEIVNKWENFIKKDCRSYELYYNIFLNILSNNNLGKFFNNVFHNIDNYSPKD